MMSIADPVPVEIILHKKSKTLEISFNTNERFIFPCEYLRVFSPSAEARMNSEENQFALGKENVNIVSIETVGQYAIKPIFSDGHQTGIFSFKTLYELGVKQKENWQRYQSNKSQSK